MQNINLYIGLAIAILGLDAYAIKQYAFDEQGNSVCTNFVFNTYLYLIGSLVYMALIVMIEAKTNIITNAINGMTELVYLVLFLGALFVSVNAMNNMESYTVSHLGWISAITLISASFTNINIKKFDIMTVAYAIMITTVIALITGYMGIYTDVQIPEWLEEQLQIVMITILAFMIYQIFIPVKDHVISQVWLNISLLPILVMLLLIYNKRVKQNALDCKNNPNYPRESFSLFSKLQGILRRVLVALAEMREKNTKNKK